jgi:threonine synthase
MSNLSPTPLEYYAELAEKISINQLLVKREDLNPSGSHKDRAIWHMFDSYIERGTKYFVISSSGNAAISAAYYCVQKPVLKLDIFISPRMPEAKKKRLDEIVSNNSNISVHVSQTAKSEAIKFAKGNHYQLIRTSTDDIALEGYKNLASELVDDITQLKLGQSEFNIFMPTSSGTTLVGLSDLRHSNILENVGMSFRLHAVQTTKCHIIARAFDDDFQPSDSSLASAIVDTVAHRKEEVVKLIRDTGGSGWVISDEALNTARAVLENNTDIKNASWDSLLSLAGLLKVLAKKWPAKNALLLFSGR